MEIVKIAATVGVIAAVIAVGLTCAIAALAGETITTEVVFLPALLAFVISVPAIVAARRRRRS